MNEAEIKEYEQTRLRVKYNNEWPKSKWISPLQEALMAKMERTGQKQLFFSLPLDEENATEIIFKDAELNRIVSTILDLYDELPLRPDAAFDVAWRALEIMTHFYLEHYYPKALEGANEHIKVPVEHKISCTANSVFNEQFKQSQPLMAVFKCLVRDYMPESVIHYIVARMFLPGELQVDTQVEKVSARCREILGKGLFDEYRQKYVKENKLDADSHRKADLLLVWILKGEKKIILEHEYDALSLQRIITFILSGILYSSRCERFHGDFFSPLKSDRSTLKTYYGQYWLLTVSYMFFWMLVHKYLEKKGVEPLFSLDTLADSVKKTLDAATTVMIKK